jgi:hypothetical protein
MINKTNVVLGILILVGLILGTLIATGIIKIKPLISKSITQPPPSDTINTPLINPQSFETGYLTNNNQKIADLCSTNNTCSMSSLFPIQPTYVNYGNAKQPEYNGCDNLIFNSPP